MALIVIVGMALYEDQRYYERTLAREDWRAAITYVVTHALPKDALFFYPEYLRQVYDYYRPASAPPIVFPQRWGWVQVATYGEREPLEGQPQALAVIKDLPRTYLRIWLFSRYVPVAPRVLAALADAYPEVEKLDFQGVGVTSYSRGY
jgi:hypothetical protein